MVAVEDGAGLVTTNHHRHPFRNACPHHIPDCRTPEVVGNLPNESCFLTRRCPRFLEALDTLPVPVKDERAVRILGQMLLPLRFNNISQFSGKVDEPPTLILGGPDFQPYRTLFEIDL